MALINTSSQTLTQKETYLATTAACSQGVGDAVGAGVVVVAMLSRRSSQRSRGLDRLDGLRE